MRSAPAGLMLMLAACAAAPSSGDDHVVLRREQGLPSSSAQGDLRILTQCLVEDGSASVVARRSPDGLWVVSWVTGPAMYRRGRTESQVLTSSDSRRVDALLADPALFSERPGPGECVHGCGKVLEAGRRRVEHPWVCSELPRLNELEGLLRPRDGG